MNNLVQELVTHLKMHWVINGEEREPEDQAIINECLMGVLTVVQEKLDRFDFV